MKPEDLTGEAARRYEVWRVLGLSESAAMSELERDGLLPVSGFDKAVKSFEALGLSPEAARTAAVGRVSESQARAGWDRAAGVARDDSRVEDLRQRIEEAQRALDSLTDEELSGKGYAVQPIQESRATGARGRFVIPEGGQALIEGGDLVVVDRYGHWVSRWRRHG